MDDVFSAVCGLIGVTFSAFCIWLIVRIVTRREKWAIWTAVWLSEGFLISGSAYFTMFYGWLTATPLSPRDMDFAVICAYASMAVFVFSTSAAVVTLVIFVRGEKSTLRVKAPAHTEFPAASN